MSDDSLKSRIEVIIRDLASKKLLEAAQAREGKPAVTNLDVAVRLKEEGIDVEMSVVAREMIIVGRRHRWNMERTIGGVVIFADSIAPL
jgi:hypothetical protein